MQIHKLKFRNRSGQTLSGLLEMPADRHPHTFVLFAHCFTCGKNLSVVRHIARALTTGGFAVLRFDFTGLGESEGDFAAAGFSSDVSDLLCAADYLGEHYRAPGVLIGHSLGGAAALAAAGRIDSVRAVATIGAPFEPQHVTRLFTNQVAEIGEGGAAEVDIGGRPFTISKQFLDDINAQDGEAVVRDLRKALLLMHSPQDTIVGIDNAARIYQAARHPKSFVSLDGADHLLSHPPDAVYAGGMIAAWASRYVEIPVSDVPATEQQVVARLDDESAFTVQIRAGRHGLVADEPASVGGDDFGPNPYDYVLAGLGACTAMTLRMYARRKKWSLRDVRVHLSHDKIHVHDCDCDLSGDTRGRLDRVQRVIELEGELDPRQRQRLLEIADRCPVHRTLEGEVLITTELREPPEKSRDQPAP